MMWLIEPSFHIQFQGRPVIVAESILPRFKESVFFLFLLLLSVQSQQIILS